LELETIEKLIQNMDEMYKNIDLDAKEMPHCLQKILYELVILIHNSRHLFDIQILKKKVKEAKKRSKYEEKSSSLQSTKILMK